MDDMHNRPCMISIIMQEQRVSGVRGGSYSNGTRHEGNKAKGQSPKGETNGLQAMLSVLHFSGA